MNNLNDTLLTRHKLLELIIDNSRDYIMLIDQHDRLVFGNKALAHMNGEINANMTGKNLADVVGEDAAKRITHKLHNLTNEAAFKQKLFIKNQEKTFHTVILPVTDDAGQALSLVVAHDISSLMEAEKQKDIMMERAVAMLSKVLAQHDPYSAQHSMIVRKVALAIGMEMNLNDTALAYLGIAASLLNAGKFYVPVELLVKQDALTGQELQIVRGHIFYTIQMLEEIGIDEEIVLTVSQSCEKYDGSGYPNGLFSDDICEPARILSLANAYVAMTCPRAWRAAIPQAEAINLLIRDPGYDKQISLVLFNLIINSGGLDLNFERRDTTSDAQQD